MAGSKKDPPADELVFAGKAQRRQEALVALADPDHAVAAVDHQHALHGAGVEIEHRLRRQLEQAVDPGRNHADDFAGRIGERVGAPGVTVVDDGTLQDRRGSLSIDDEGNPSERTVLIEDGKIKAVAERMSIPADAAAIDGRGWLLTPGLIDAAYRGEIKVLLVNLSNDKYVVKANERIAQLVIAPVIFVTVAGGIARMSDLKAEIAKQFKPEPADIIVKHGEPIVRPDDPDER